MKARPVPEDTTDTLAADMLLAPGCPERRLENVPFTVQPAQADAARGRRCTGPAEPFGLDAGPVEKR